MGLDSLLLYCITLSTSLFSFQKFETVASKIGDPASCPSRLNVRKFCAGRLPAMSANVARSAVPVANLAPIARATRRLAGTLRLRRGSSRYRGDSTHSSISVATRDFQDAYNNTSKLRRLQESEQLCRDMERAWTLNFPEVDLQSAIRAAREGRQESHEIAEDSRSSRKPSNVVDHLTDQTPTNFTEPSNAEDFEFDESRDFDNSIDGMGFLTTDPRKAGYTGPQSGIAALKFLRSLPLYLPLDHVSTPSCLDEGDTSGGTPQAAATISHYINEYFSLYHPAYPILHEGTFRARVSGKFDIDAE